MGFAYEYFFADDLRRVKDGGKDGKHPRREQKLPMKTEEPPFMMEAALERAGGLSLVYGPSEWTHRTLADTLPGIRHADVRKPYDALVGAMERTWVWNADGLEEPTFKAATFTTDNFAQQTNSKISDRLARRDEAIAELREGLADAAIEEMKRRDDALSGIHDAWLGETQAENERHEASAKTWENTLKAETEAKQAAKDAAASALEAAKAEYDAADTEEAVGEAREKMEAAKVELAKTERELAWAKERAKLVPRTLDFIHRNKLGEIDKRAASREEAERRRSSKAIARLADEFDDAVDEETDSCKEDVSKFAAENCAVDRVTKQLAFEWHGFNRESEVAYGGQALRFLLSDKHFKGHGFWVADAQGNVTREEPHNNRQYLFLADAVDRIYADMERMTRTYSFAEPVQTIRSAHRETRHSVTATGHETTETSNVPDKPTTGDVWGSLATSTVSYFYNANLMSYRSFETHDYANVAYGQVVTKNGTRLIEGEPLVPRTKYHVEEDFSTDSTRIKMQITNAFLAGTVVAVRADAIVAAVCNSWSSRMDGRFVKDEDQGPYPEEPYWGEYVHLENSKGERIAERTPLREKDKSVCSMVAKRVSFRLIETDEKTVTKRKELWQTADDKMTSLRSKLRDQLRSLDSSWRAQWKAASDAAKETRTSTVKELDDFRAAETRAAIEAASPAVRAANDEIERIVRMDWLDGDDRDMMIAEQTAIAEEAWFEAWSPASRRISAKEREAASTVSAAEREVEEVEGKWRAARTEAISKIGQEMGDAVNEVFAELSKLPRAVETWEADVEPIPVPDAGDFKGDLYGRTESVHFCCLRNVVVEYDPRTLLGFDISEYDLDDPAEWGKAREPPARTTGV